MNGRKQRVQKLRVPGLHVTSGEDQYIHRADRECPLAFQKMLRL